MSGIPPKDPEPLRRPNGFGVTRPPMVSSGWMPSLPAVTRRPPASRANPAWFLSVPAVLLATLIGLLESAPALPVCTGLLFCAGWMVLKLDRQERDNRIFLQTLFSWGFLIRVVYAVLLYYWLVKTRGEPFLGGGDDWTLERTSERMFHLWKQGNFELPWRHPAYPILLVGIRYAAEGMGGYHTFLPLMVNACFGALIAPYLFLLARNIFGHRVAVMAGLMVMLFPNFVFYSSVQLRDIIIVFFFVYSLSRLSAFIVQGRASGVVLAVAAAIPMLYLRTVYGYLLLGMLAIALALCLLFQPGPVKRHRWLKVILMAAGFLLLAGTMKFMTGSGVPPPIADDSALSRPLEEGYAESHALRQRDHSLSAAAEGSLGAVLLSRLPFGTGFLILPAVAFIMPYPPWAAFASQGSLAFIYFINALTWTLLMPASLLGLLIVLKRRFPENILILAPMILILMASSAGGFTDRYKLAAMPFALVLAAVGLLNMIEDRRGSGRLFYAMVQIGLAGAYYTAKILMG